MIPRRRIPNAPRRSGTVTVEVALTLPVVFLLLFGAVEFSRLNMLRNSIQNACYEAARRGALPGGDADDARAAASRILDAAGARNAIITVTPADIVSTTDEVTVTIEVPLDGNAWVSPRFTAHQTLTKSCTLTCERTTL